MPAWRAGDVDLIRDLNADLDPVKCRIGLIEAVLDLPSVLFYSQRVITVIFVGILHVFQERPAPE